MFDLIFLSKAKGQVKSLLLLYLIIILLSFKVGAVLSLPFILNVL